MNGDGRLLVFGGHVVGQIAATVDGLQGEEGVAFGPVAGIFALDRVCHRRKGSQRVVVHNRVFKGREVVGIGDMPHLIDVHLHIVLRRTVGVVAAEDHALDGGAAGVGGILSAVGGADIDNHLAVHLSFGHVFWTGLSKAATIDVAAQAVDLVHRAVEDVHGGGVDLS